MGLQEVIDLRNFDVLILNFPRCQRDRFIDYHTLTVEVVFHVISLCTYRIDWFIYH